jgi:hypothetical protein
MNTFNPIQSTAYNFIILPMVLIHSELTAEAFRIYCHLMYRSQNNNVYISYKDIRNRLHLNNSTITESISQLHKLQLIDVTVNKESNYNAVAAKFLDPDEWKLKELQAPLVRTYKSTPQQDFRNIQDYILKSGIYRDSNINILKDNPHQIQWHLDASNIDTEYVRAWKKVTGRLEIKDLDKIFHASLTAINEWTDTEQIKKFLINSIEDHVKRKQLHPPDKKYLISKAKAWVRRLERKNEHDTETATVRTT